MAKAIGLLSGGLDSTLAVRLILEQGIEVKAVNFVTPFCTCTKKGCQNEAKKVSEKFGIELKIIGFKEEYIALVKSPKYGYGKNMNPCIDCRIFMYSKAREIMKQTSADFVFTGEVLGERPMSQNLKAMKIIEKESGLEGRLLRPLCAKHLPPTIVEKKGIVDRDRLLSITGRSRKPQISLAQSLGIDDYPCPAGGCRLTDPNFARRLRDAFEHNEDSLVDITLLRYGRHFRLASGAKVIVGRNEEENKILSSFASENRILLEVKNVKGPIALMYKHNGKGDIELGARICLAYSDYEGNEKVSVRIGEDREVLVQPIIVSKLKKVMV
uniref:Uncharacterized protein n=1 Tax=candidate division WOR-3 bacterium TaxID=2052148 RepID=A0A7C6EHM1_UNCW3